MADQNRIHRVVLHWSSPQILEDIDTNWKCNEYGLYFITRKIGEKESPIYVGETKRCFVTRINEHYRSVSEFFNKRGKKYIRLGTIVKPKSLSTYNEEEKKHLLQLIESRLVENLFDRQLGSALCNKRQVGSYTEWFKLHIENRGWGRYGLLPSVLPYSDDLEE